MTLQRQLLIWILAALAATALLAAVLVWEHKYTRQRYATFLAGDPHEGARLFEKKGCIQCHRAGGASGWSGQALGVELRPKSTINELVAAMWNHAPRMWERMRAENVAYPVLSHEELAHLFAYLYTVRYLDEPGDTERGRQQFGAKGCRRCHAARGQGGKIGPDLSVLGGVDTPIVWTQAMWNHAPAMEAWMQKLGLAWPKFEDGEMNDLLAYVREVSGGPRREYQLLPADPDRGGKLFESKSCIVCHSVKGEGGRIGPALGARRQPPTTIVQFAGLMWNHSPEMWRAMKARNIPRPTFEGHEMADLIAFLYSVQYFEPGGSPQLGESLFARRGCSRCHGAHAEGTVLGPALGGRGKTFSSIALGQALWSHGQKMYQRAQQLGVPWPTLAESDVGDLVVFLNTPLENR